MLLCLREISSLYVRIGKSIFPLLTWGRRARFRQSKCTPEHRLDFVDSTAGLFHMQIQVLAMLFGIYLGDESHHFGLAKVIRRLNRDPNKLWNRDKTIVKNFTACQSLFDHTLDAHIIAQLASDCGCNDIPQFFNFLSHSDPESIKNKIYDLATLLTDYGRINNMRKYTDKNRDSEYENHLMFMQHGSVLRNFVHAMRHGDSGRVVTSLAYFTVWFQASRKYNYAQETIHLMACIKKIWSDAFRKYWLDNCLINPSGHAEGWLACDFLGEYVVREVQRMLSNNLNDRTSHFLREVISVQVLLFRSIRKQMLSECGFRPNDRSTKVPPHEDIKAVADWILELNRCVFSQGRKADVEVLDLHGQGIKHLGSYKRISEYKTKLERDNRCITSLWDSEMIRVERDYDEEESDVDQSEHEYEDDDDEAEDDS